MPRVYPTRTVLARRIRERRLTFEELVERLEVFARDNHEVGTMSLRHVQRLTAGLCTAAQLRPATVRLLERFFESSIDELLAAPDVSIEQLSITQLIDEAQQAAEEEEPRLPGAGGPVAKPRSFVSVGRSPVSQRNDRVDPDADMQAMQAFRAADTKVGGGYLYATVVDYLYVELAPRLFGMSHDTDGRQVFTSAAALTEMAGWMAHDAGKEVIARRHLGRSLDLVKVGGDRQLEAHIFASMSHLAHYHDQPHQAIKLASRGIDVLRSGPPQPTLQAKLLTMQAKGMSALGRAEECIKLLIEAERELSDSADGRESSPWCSNFDEASFANEAASCMRQLGRLSEAQRQAQRVLELRPRDRVRSRAFGQLTLVTVLIAHGDTDHACELVTDILDSTQSLGSYVVLRQLLDVKEVFQQRRAGKPVADLSSRKEITSPIE